MCCFGHGTPIGPAGGRLLLAIYMFEVADLITEKTKTEVSEHTHLAVLAKSTEAEVTLERFEEGLNFPPPFSGLADDGWWSWSGQDDEPLLPPLLRFEPEAENA